MLYLVPQEIQAMRSLQRHGNPLNLSSGDGLSVPKLWNMCGLESKDHLHQQLRLCGCAVSCTKQPEPNENKTAAKWFTLSSVNTSQGLLHQSDYPVILLTTSGGRQLLKRFWSKINPLPFFCWWGPGKKRRKVIFKAEVLLITIWP